MRRPRTNLVIAITASAAVLAAVVVGVVLLDSPAQARLRRLDERRVEDLREIGYAIDAYWSREGRLPASLDDLSEAERIVRELADPETGEPYEYRLLGEDAYELCAVFADDTVQQYETPFRDPWFHGPGRRCIQLKARDAEQPMER